MSLFKRTDASPERAERAIAIPWSVGSSTSSGESVTTHKALQIGAVWRCVSLVAELLSSLPVDLVRDSGGISRPVPIEPPIVSSPSLRVTRREWIFEYVVSMMLHGQAFGLVLARDATNRPTVVEWLDPTCVTVDCPDSLSLPIYRIDGQIVDRANIVHVRNFLLPGCIEGLSPVEYHAETLGLSIATRKFGAQWFGQGGHPSAILSTEMPLDPEQAKTMKERFLASVRGKREPAVLGAGIKYTPIQINPNESQFIESRNMNVAEIALMFGVPAEFIGGAQAGAQVTYANRDQRWLDFIATCLRHYAIRLEEAWSAMTVRGQEVRLNLDALLRGDTAARYGVHAVALQNHFLTIDEVRALENRPPLNNGEQFPSSGSSNSDTPSPEGG